MELIHMVETAYRIDDKPSAVRYPRASAYGVEILKDLFGTELVNDVLPARGTALPIGKGRVIKRGRENSVYKACILSLGTRLMDSVLAARKLEATHADLGVTVADARFMKPLDTDLIRELAQQHDILVTIEEGSVGGFGDHVLHFLSENGLLDSGNLRMRSMVIPDMWIEQGPQQDQYDIAGLNEPHIIEKIEGLTELLRAQTHRQMATAVDVKGGVTTAAKGGVTTAAKGGVTTAAKGGVTTAPLFNVPFQQEEN
jgi:1-deoxy-D-xylulose-5-phosphate synthase